MSQPAVSRMKNRLNGQCVRGPGEDSTGAAGAERELGFHPQPKAELAQGEYKGAREVLTRHAHTGSRLRPRRPRHAATARGPPLNFLGCSLDLPTFASAIKCHQKSPSNSAGSSVGSLAPPRATPRLGGVYVSCQYFPCSFVLALRELGLRLGVKAQLPLRASSRGVLPGAGALEYGNRRILSSWLIKTAVSNSISSLSGDYSSASQPSAPPAHPLRHNPLNRVDQLTRVLSDTASVVTLRSPVLELLRERGYTAPRDPTPVRTLFPLTLSAGPNFFISQV
jgi:hypothetical protein